MKSKLVFILTEFPPHFGGMQTHAEAMCANLEQEYDLTIFTYKETKLRDEAELFDKKSNYTVHRILSRVSFHGNIKKLKKALKSINPTLIYSSTIFYGYLRKHTQIPIVCRSVGNDMLRPWIIYPFKFGSALLNTSFFEYFFNLIKKNLYKPPYLDYFFSKRRIALSIECAQGANCILANSSYTKEIFERNRINQCQILVGGVDVKKFKRPSQINRAKLRIELELDPNDFTIITACRFVKKKGVDFLIEAFEEIEHIYPNLKLVIIGDGPLRKSLIKKAKSANIKFVGKKIQNEITKYYWAADLFVLCSREVVNPLTGFKDVETMGRVLCEANAAGIPVLASNTGGVSSVIHHDTNGLLYNTDDIESFKAGFRVLYLNRSKTEQLIGNGIRKANVEFSWSAIIKEHRALFDSLIQSSQNRE